MDQLATLAYAVDELRRTVAALDDSQMDTVTNCAPWTVRQLASHALNNQLVWAGMVTGRELVSFADTMAAVPHEGDLAALAEEVAARAVELWGTDGVLHAMHATPFGELPGSVVVTFPTIDAIAHAWDLSVSVGHPIEFDPQAIPSISAVVETTCNDDARALGLIKAATETPPDATDTERLMAAAGRSINR
ncbi:MAG TPA: TIGR03086 family metal-binding protein [Ilumatobacteraceae bacterium]|nr:TIGR03086 family metal-binding protein [Ilumatobacteraceae bacterium]